LILHLKGIFNPYQKQIYQKFTSPSIRTPKQLHFVPRSEVVSYQQELIFYLRTGFELTITLITLTFNPKYAIDNLLRAEIASKSATSLLFSISP
jgi:hypothetical protein